MKRYKENDIVIYKDSNGLLIDIFVIFNTDISTGLTHINHQNLKMPACQLKRHTAFKKQSGRPIKDGYSFELFKQLKKKYAGRESIIKDLKKKLLNETVPAETAKPIFWIKKYH